MSRPVLVELARFECLSPQAACTAPLQGMQLDICQATTLLPSTAPCQLASSPYCLHFSLRHSMTHLLALCRGCHDGCSTSQLRAAGQEAPNISLAEPWASFAIIRQARERSNMPTKLDLSMAQFWKILST